MKGFEEYKDEEKQIITVTKEAIVKCDDCRKELLKFVVSDSQANSSTMKVKCIKCNSLSFLYKFDKRVFITPMEDTYINNIVDNIVEIGY